MRYAAMIAVAALGMPLGMAVAEEPLYEVEWEEEQGEGFVPYSGVEGHPSVGSLYCDDFTLSESAVVDRIAWFGYSDNWDNVDLTNFTVWEIWIYEGQGQGVEPGEMIYQETFTKEATNPEPLGPYGLENLAGVKSIMYRHEVTLSETVELEGNNQYWIGIGANAINGGSDWWVWAQAPPGDETIARWIWADEEWMVQGPDWDPDWPTYNVAFELFGEKEEFTCPADITGPDDQPDGMVDVFDLLMVIGEWGECSDPENCPADITGPDDQPDGVVDVFDLLKVIGEWGACP